MTIMPTITCKKSFFNVKEILDLESDLMAIAKALPEFSVRRE